ncbi:unnamed protein product [Penicillium olsonii]|uniref:Dynamin GTPase domain-containing protein n=1 Tax=Penicillium olsonii TaxID=99116 RepID=A0A9W4IKS4_PENOL|nr:unnamed protein product [Penicillium olsonii]CAG8301239.1 unnamed protein product [Penicillium olsonii]
MSEPTKVAQTEPHLRDGPCSLFERISELRSMSIGSLVDLPQLLICGDEASDKHSVLQAIARMPFPVNNSATQFVTEVHLHRQPKSLFRVAIRPTVPNNDNDKDAPMKSSLIGHVANTKGLLALIEKATNLIVSKCNSGFSEEVLQLEIAGPNKPNLTVVDLPGLHHTGVDEGNKPVEIARKYMKSPRRIILAVLSADLEFQTQKVLDLATEFDPKQKRTLGIITHPHKLVALGHSSLLFSEIANRKLTLGWLLLPDHIAQKQNTELTETDSAEILREKDWEALGKCANNVENLPDWLGDIFSEKIQKDVSGLISDIDAVVMDRTSMLPKLVLPRETLGQQKNFLSRLSHSFEHVLNQALRGVYTEAFFDTRNQGPNINLDDPRRLCVIVHALNEHFADAMQAIGCHRKIISSADRLASGDSFRTASNPYRNIRRPESLTRANFEREVEQRIQRDGGLTGVGGLEHSLLGALFREQTQPWEEIAHVHLITTWKSVRTCVVSVLQYFTDQPTSDLIMKHIIDPKLESLKIDLLEKLKELVAYYKRGQLLPSSKTILAQVEKRRNDRLSAYFKQTYHLAHQSGASTAQVEMDTQSLRTLSEGCIAADAVDLLQAHYDASDSNSIDYGLDSWRC